jgi:hypothetical protein
MNDTEPGRSCPLRYRYGAAALAQAPEEAADTLYVIGGLYGNLRALDAVAALAQREATPPRLCFNGDFHWFDVDDAAHSEINARVLVHDALQGNVEAEFGSAGDEAGCGCAYPESVDAGVVARSNLIHRQLKATAARQPVAVQAQIAALPMFRRYRVGHTRVGVVHGDAESLAGWRFDVAALDDPAALPWLRQAFAQAQVEVFASTHTCLPALRSLGAGLGVANNGAETPGRAVVNNGAAGMPNFQGQLSGLCTRIATTPAPGTALHEQRLGDVHIALLPLAYDAPRWRAEFEAQWPPGSAAHQSYFARITQGPGYAPAQARPRVLG